MFGFGGIYVAGNATAQTLSAGVAAKVTALASRMTSGKYAYNPCSLYTGDGGPDPFGICAHFDNGSNPPPIYCIDPDETNQRVAVKGNGGGTNLPSSPGPGYRVSFHASISSAIASVALVELEVRYDGTNAIPGSHAEIEIPANGKGQIAMPGAFAAEIGDSNLELFIKSDQAGDLTITDAALAIDTVIPSSAHFARLTGH